MEEEMARSALPCGNPRALEDPLNEQALTRVDAKIDMDRYRVLPAGHGSEAASLGFEHSGLPNARFAQEPKRAIVLEVRQSHWRRCSPPKCRLTRVDQKSA